MTKKIKRFSFLLVFIILPGCLNYQQITTIKKDHTGSMFIHYWMSWNTPIDSVLIETIGLFNEDSVTVQYRAGFTKINSVNIFKNFSDSTIHAQIDFSFSNLDSLNKLSSFSGANFSIEREDEDTETFSQNIQYFSSGFGFENSDISVEYVYYLPGKIIEHNADELSMNKLVWKLNAEKLGKVKTLKAKYIPFKLKETPKWIYFLAGLMLLIVFFFLFRRR